MWLAISLVALADTGVQNPAEGTDVQGTGPVEIRTLVERLGDGEPDQELLFEPLAPESRLDTGDQVQYTIRVTNPGEEPIGELVVTKRLPGGLRYVAGTAVGPGCEIRVSDDGGRTFRGSDSTIAVSAANEPEPFTPVPYTHVQWILSGPLSAGATAILRFRATFN